MFNVQCSMFNVQGLLIITGASGYIQVNV